jgi:hypothetical protein
LIFDQEDFKVFLIKYHKFIALTLGIDAGHYLDYVIRVYERECLIHGSVSTVKLFKQLYDVALRIATSNTFEPIPFRKANKLNEPKILGPLIQLLHGSLNQRRVALHCLSTIKLVDCTDPNFKVETICQEPLLPRLPMNEPPKVGNYFKKFKDNNPNYDTIDLDRLSHCYKRVLEQMFPKASQVFRRNEINKLSSIHFSGRNGPNGPCLSTVVLDHAALAPLNTTEPGLLTSISAMARMTKNTDLLTLLNNFADEPYIWSNNKSIKPEHSRISLKRESWAKTRPFAICDYLSQSSLKGFHRWLFNQLETFKEDGTFNQDRVSEIVRGWTSPGGLNQPESADLSAATDSIPIEVQGEIVSHIAGQAFSHTWMKIASDRKFKLPNSGDYINYTVGQPMGLLSSWAMLAMWHHVMIRTCLEYLSIKRDPQTPVYVVIGDDTCMNGSRIFSIYKEIVGTIQGVGISKYKGYHQETQHSENTIRDIVSNGESMITAELAKRVFCCGQEITVIPPDELYSSFRSASQFPEILISLQKRGYPSTKITEVPSLTSLCHHKKLALLLCTSPWSRCSPEGDNTEVTNMLTALNVFWFKPEYNHEKFKLLMIKELKLRIVAILRSMVSNVNQWMAFLLKDQEISVKAWSYQCETQALLLFLIVQYANEYTERQLGEDKLKEIFPKRGEINITLLKKYIHSIQILFEVDLLFKEQADPKLKPQREFTNNFISELLRKVVSEQSQQPR